ncbi:amino acid ABC transporter permease [Candidatus Persebacteraceae bacterium Df01]|jgi:polar amino acid transport system permease protein|uniref:Amino acid ABC transporter permease n=1 Tax=Candidatus Doriopsillibacter californiensis TaxID=2970740 RepID=A0ABT7QK39_9GAMM|nr:amino acid ABC transporter permease [Candidatus Persebacteraceae bacterium Df01]
MVIAFYRGVVDMDYRWRWGRLWRYILREEDGGWVPGPLLYGAMTTIKISLLAAALAVVFGLLTTAARVSPQRSFRGLASGYANIMRCTPLLVQLYLWYFIVGSAFGWEQFTIGVFALALFEGAFAAEIFRAGIINVPQAQIDAAQALGLSRARRWRLIIIPQALPLVLPPLANLFVSLIKHSSIVTVIAIADLTDAARNLVSETFLTFEIWLIVGALYVAVCLPLALILGRWETRVQKNK